MAYIVMAYIAMSYMAYIVEAYIAAVCGECGYISMVASTIGPARLDIVADSLPRWPWHIEWKTVCSDSRDCSAKLSVEKCRTCRWVHACTYVCGRACGHVCRHVCGYLSKLSVKTCRPWVCACVRAVCVRRCVRARARVDMCMDMRIVVFVDMCMTCI